jgi:hypothetical protein
MPMKFRLPRYILGLAAAMAFLGGCSGAGAPPLAASGSPLVGPGSGVTTLGPRSGVTPLGARRVAFRSWMKRVPKGTLLLYAAQFLSVVDVFTYPKGRLVGAVTGFASPQGVCSDSQGNAYVTDQYAGSAYEIEHGTTNVINSWFVGGLPNGCSVSANGDLAITVGSGYSSAPGWVTVFPAGGQSGTTYPSASVLEPAGYDDKGNLFAEICPSVSSCSYPSVFEIPAGGSSWIKLTLSGATLYFPTAIEMMGRHTIGVGDARMGGFSQDTSGIYSTTLSGTTLTVKHTTLLTAQCQSGSQGGFVTQQWANESKSPNGLQTKRVTRVIAGNEFEPTGNCPVDVDTFAFPAGGVPVKSFEIKQKKGYFTSPSGQTLTKE